MSLHFTTKHLSTIKICLCVYGGGGGGEREAGLAFHIIKQIEILYNTLGNANNYNRGIFN